MFTKKTKNDLKVGEEISLLANRLNWVHTKQGVTHFLLGSLDEDLSYLCKHLQRKLSQLAKVDVELHCIDEDDECVPMISENKIVLIYCNHISTNPHIYNSLNLTEMGFLFVKAGATNRFRLNKVLKFMEELKANIEGLVFYNHRSFTPKWIQRVMGR